MGGEASLFFIIMTKEQPEKTNPDPVPARGLTGW
jgi:hypothetical protein